MLPSTPPLLTRLRRRMAAMTWLLALLVLAKASFATVCLTDGMSSAPTGMTVFADANDVRPDPSLDGDGGLCWHGGAQGCHCSCVHGSAIAPGHWFLAAAPAPAMMIASVSPPIMIALRDDNLRPPIV
ncbi:MAG: hypothetical protein J0H86_06085 [Xanthomonadaceae bacterium]|nr:hypothetical protein [Xanthomonadaceae bacterium]